MEYKDDERPSLNGHGTGQLESPQHAAVPATLLPTVLSHLGLGDRPMAGGDQALAALRDEKSHVRVAAIRSLGEGRETSSLQFLVSALHDPAWEVRAAAVWALSAFGGQAPVEALIEALADEDGSVRAAALRVLSGVRGQVPPEPLASMLHDADWQVREAAALTVEELGEQAPGPLVARLRDEKAVEREAAQMPHKQSHPDVLPSLPFTLRRAMQIEVLGDRYQLQDPIGRGGMATIYRGRDLRMDRVVAIKVLREVYNTDPKFVTRFQREAKAASALQHPNIVQVYDYGQTDGNYYIVMELVEGTDLRRYLRYRGVLDIDRAVIIAHDVALGLGAAHRRGIVHRDVKPQNVLVGRDGSIKLTDFGIASVYKDINAERLTTTGMTLGTVQYYAPEQAQGEIVSPAADVYGLGIVMYEMLTGHTPFNGDSPVAVAMQHIQDPPIPPSQFNSNIPAALEEIILRCLEKVPEMRFRDGSSLARALEGLGEADIVEGATVPITPGHVQTPPASPILNQIPPRPNSSRSSTQGPPISSLKNPVGVPVSVQGGLKSSVNNMADQQPLFNQQVVGSPPTEAGSTRPFQRGTMPRSGVVQDQRDLRFASIITVLILLATSLLLGFSIYQAVQLGFLPFPGLGNPTATPVTQVDVPDLKGLDLQAAQHAAGRSGFKIQVLAGPPDGIVKDQDPAPPAKAAPGSTIRIDMEPKPKHGITVPGGLVGNTLAAAEAILDKAGIPYNKPVSAGTDKTKGPNIVQTTDPLSGQILPPGKKVILYVWNLNVTPTVPTSPSPSPSPSPTPTPTAFMLQDWWLLI